MRRCFTSNQYLAALACAAIAFAVAFSPSAVAEEPDPARPTLADLMMLTQLRHDKLWYATRVENWQLAAYEFHQFETTIDRIVKLYPMVSSSRTGQPDSREDRPGHGPVAQRHNRQEPFAV